MKNRVVIALGGNAIQSNVATAAAQQAAIRRTIHTLKPIFETGDDIVMTHGNGPQIGNLLIQQAASDTPQTPAMPLDVCGAMTQGMIGYWLETELNALLSTLTHKRAAAAVVTRVEVDKNDEKLSNPTKPIGPFYDETALEQQRALYPNAVFKEDAGRGYRKVVPSPLPVSILEHDVISDLVQLNNVVVACGGGGIPVVKTQEGYEGIEAVIDKDFASATLADKIGAQTLMILTAVDHVFINYKQPNEAKLSHVSVAELETYIEKGYFAEGSMLPKIEAAIQFVTGHPERKVIITSLEKAYRAFENQAGTHIHA